MTNVRGRPRKNHTRPIFVYLTEELKAAVDQARGEDTLAQYVRSALMEKVEREQ